MTKQPNMPGGTDQRQTTGQTGASRQQQQFEAAAPDRIAAQIREHMEVIGSDGGKVGRVDAVEAERIRVLRKSDDAQGRQWYLPLDQVQAIEGNAVRLTCAAEDADLTPRG